jgi:hypothetical protein
LLLSAIEEKFLHSTSREAALISSKYSTTSNLKLIANTTVSEGIVACLGSVSKPRNVASSSLFAEQEKNNIESAIRENDNFFIGFVFKHPKAFYEIG